MFKKKQPKRTFSDAARLIVVVKNGLKDRKNMLLNKILTTWLCLFLDVTNNLSIFTIKGTTSKYDKIYMYHYGTYHGMRFSAFIKFPAYMIK